MRRILALVAIAALTACTTSSGDAPSGGATGAPAAFSWDGDWRGMSSGGRPTTVRIVGGKVTQWTNNGYPRASVSGTVGPNSVTLNDNNSWTATMVRQGNGTAVLNASGIGNNGAPAKNRAVLTKR